MMEATKRHTLLVIGGSAGALLMLLDIVQGLPSSAALSVLVVLHRKYTEPDTLVALIADRTSFQVREVEDKDILIPGHIFIAPPDYHVLMEKDGTLSLDDSEKVNFSRPSIDVTFDSVSEVWGDKLVCILLSGANADGAAGLAKAKNKGAYIVVQDPATSEFPMMPQQAINQVSVDMLLNKQNLSQLFRLLDERSASEHQAD